MSDFIIYTLPPNDFRTCGTRRFTVFNTERKKTMDHVEWFKRWEDQVPQCAKFTDEQRDGRSFWEELYQSFAARFREEHPIGAIGEPACDFSEMGLIQKTEGK